MYDEKIDDEALRADFTSIVAAMGKIREHMYITNLVVEDLAGAFVKMARSDPKWASVAESTGRHLRALQECHRAVSELDLQKKVRCQRRTSILQ